MLLYIPSGSDLSGFINENNRRKLSERVININPNRT